MTNTVDPAAQHTEAANAAANSLPGQLTLEVGPMAHGGHCIARHEGQLVFVRHAIPGEIVVVQLTESGPAGRFWWADTIKVLRASEFRRAHQWKVADSLRAYPAGRRPISEAPLGHIVIEHQLRLKALAFRDTMVRIGQYSVEDVDVSVVGMEDDEPSGLQWRTRNSFAVTAGRLSMPMHHNAGTVPVRNIPLAVPQLDKLQLWKLDFPGAVRVEVATPAHSREALISIIPDPKIAQPATDVQPYLDAWKQQLADLPGHVSAIATVPKKGKQLPEVEVLRGRSWVHEQVQSQRWGTRTFQVSGTGYWHAHRDGPVTLVDSVMQAAGVQPGQVIANLYAGAGMFSRYLGEAVGSEGAVLSVDAAPNASRDAQHNLNDLPQATVLNGKIQRVLASWLLTPQANFSEAGLMNRHVDTVVLTPPRKGVGRATMNRLDQLNPDKIVYVSINPASLAKDSRWLRNHGWHLNSLQVYDLAPETQHTNAVSVFTR